MLINFLTKNHNLSSLIHFSTLLYSRDLFLILTLNILYHWMILKNECILSYQYKKNKNKKYILGSNTETNDLNRPFLFGIFLFIFMYLITSYLLYKYIPSRKIMILFNIVYISTISCYINNKLHNSIFNNVFILFLIIIFSILVKKSNELFYITLFCSLFFIFIIYQAYLKNNDKDLLIGLNYYLLLIIIIIIVKNKK